MLTIYGIPISVHTRKVILTALMKGIEHKVEPVLPFHPPEGWEELSPTGLIPAIADGDISMADSAVICRYLDGVQARPALYPRASKDCYRALFLEAYGGGEVFAKLVRPLFHQKVLGPKLFNKPTDQAEVDRLEAEVQPRLFGYIEKQAGGRYLVGDAFSIADFTIASNLINYRYLGFDIDTKLFPRLAKYMTSIVEEPPFATALAAEAPFADRMGLDRSFLN